MKSIAVSVLHAILILNSLGAVPVSASVTHPSATAGYQQSQQQSEFSACTYPSLQAAISSIGDRRATLQIACNVDVNTSVTIPDNVSVAFSGQGRFTISVGRVLRILGGIESPLQHIFYGEGKVSFLDSRSVVSTHQKEVWANWWGVVGDEVADDTVAINAAFEALSNGMTLLFPFNFRMKVTSFVGPTNKRNIRIAGWSPTGSGASPRNNIPYFIWYGPDGGSPVFRVRNVRDSIFENFAVFGAHPTTGFEHGADRILDINQDQTPGSEDHHQTTNSEIWLLRQIQTEPLVSAFSLEIKRLTPGGITASFSVFTIARYAPVLTIMALSIPIKGLQFISTAITRNRLCLKIAR